MQAVLILAHKNIDQVIKLSQQLIPTFNVYIHFDTKTDLSSEQVAKLEKMNLQYISKYNVKWGSYSIVKATIALMELALENKQNTQFHLISGQDWPIKPAKEIYDYFEGNDKIYMDYYRMLDKVKTHEPEIWWVKYYFNYDQINRRTFFGKVYHRVLLLVEHTLNVNKLKKYHLDEDQMYAGQEWIDIPRKPLEFALKYYKEHPELDKVYSTSFCSDEMWLQTVLCNSEYRKDIDKNIHRFIVKEAGKLHGEKPIYLTENNFDDMIKSDDFFARKLTTPTSDKLIEMLIEHNNKDNKHHD